jgi:4'-phosphopantetheinyl transferase
VSKKILDKIESHRGNLLNEPSSLRVTVFDDFGLYSRDELLLSSDEVHVWQAFLEREESHFNELAQTLSENERLKAKRFYFQKDQRRFVVTHGILRNILGRYLNVEPNRLKFSYGSHGKPAIDGVTDGHSLCFNMSHSYGLALFAFAWRRRVGVDVEYVHPMPDAEEIAERFFSPRENAALRTVPAGKKLEAFFNCWTRKEAFLKAIGDGLSRSLDSFEVSLFPGEPARLLSVEGDPQEAFRWYLRALAPASGYMGALAVEHKDPPSYLTKG